MLFKRAALLGSGSPRRHWRRDSTQLNWAHGFYSYLGKDRYEKAGYEEDRTTRTVHSGITRDMVRQQAFRLFRDKLNNEELRWEDWGWLRKTGSRRWKQVTWQSDKRHRTGQKALED